MIIAAVVGSVVGSSLAVTRRVVFGEMHLELTACRQQPYCEPRADFQVAQNRLGVSFDLGDKGPSWVDARPLHMAGVPRTLIAVVAIVVGGSDQHFETTIVDANPGEIREVVAPHIPSTSQDGLCAGHFGKSGTPGLLVTTFVWGDEAHYDPHRYSVTRYEWTGRFFEKQRARTTTIKHKGWKSALQELGYHCDRDLVTDALGGKEGALESDGFSALREDERATERRGVRDGTGEPQESYGSTRGHENARELRRATRLLSHRP